MYNKDDVNKKYNDGISEKSLSDEDILISQELDFGKDFLIKEELYDKAADAVEEAAEKTSKKSENKPENPHNGHRMRMYKRYEDNGFSGFPEHEVLEMLLYHGIPYKDTNPIAHNVLKKFGSLENVLDADVNSLVGAGLPVRAALILTQFRELENYLRVNKPADEYILTAEAAGSFCCERFGYANKETFYLICLTSKRKVIAVNKISEGQYDCTDSNPGEVVKAALRHNASMVVLCHNHPSGELNPSSDDYYTTQTIVRLLESVGIGVVDHIICHRDKFTSLFERGTLYS